MNIRFANEIVADKYATAIRYFMLKILVIPITETFNGFVGKCVNTVMSIATGKLSKTTWPLSAFGEKVVLGVESNPEFSQAKAIVEN